LENVFKIGLNRIQVPFNVYTEVIGMLGIYLVRAMLEYRRLFLCTFSILVSISILTRRKKTYLNRMNFHQSHRIHAIQPFVFVEQVAQFQAEMTCINL
jgi:hypothetical protein